MLSLIAFALASEPTDDAPAASEPSQEAEEKKGEGQSFLVLPGAFYSQETTLGFAVYGSATFRLPGTGEETWPSTVNAAVVGTLRKQVSFAVWPTLFLGNHNDWVVDGSYIVSHFPTQYYGIGPEADADFQSFTRRWLTTETRVLRKLDDKLYVGIEDTFSVTGIRDVTEPTGDAQLGAEPVPGGTGGVLHGLGLVARFENRDNAQSTRSGTYLQLETSGHAGFLGSDFAFTRTRLDTRAFHTLPGDWTFAGQWLTEVRTGDVPFTHMGKLGGDNVMRGLFDGRFRDKSLMALQGELRFPLFWRLRGVGFANAGQVFGSEPFVVSPAWTAGGGLRLELDETAHSTLRLDVGGGPDGFGFILNFGEAF